MTHVVAPTPKTDGLRMQLDNATADRVAITECARFVKLRMAEGDSAEAWLSVGRALSELKSYLRKVVPPGDESRIGWKKAFKQGEFRIKRDTAEKLIAIHRAFHAASKDAIPQLPISSDTLHFLARTIPLDVVEKYAASGKITPATTEADIGRLARRLRARRQRLLLKRSLGRLRRRSSSISVP